MRTDDCYVYGIPFLEIVHGGDEKAKSRHMQSIGAVLRSDFSHPAVISKISLNEYGDKQRSSAPGTALRLVLRHNPAPLTRTDNSVFKGFKPDFKYVRNYNPIEWPVWQLETGDTNPFRVVQTSVEDVIETLVGDPLKPADNRKYDGRYWDELEHAVSTEKIRELSAEVLDVDYLRVDNVARWLNLSVTKFFGIKAALLGTMIADRFLIDSIGCPIEWIQWCRTFFHSLGDCLCNESLGPLRGYLGLNVLNEEGGCQKQSYYMRESEPIISILWDVYGKGWTPPWQQHSDETPYLAAQHYCIDKRCKCPSWARCKQGDAVRHR